MCNEHGIVFARPPVRVHTVFFRGHVAEDDGNILRQFADFFTHADTFVDIIRLVPVVADEIPGNGQFRKDDKIAAFFNGFVYIFFHFCRIDGSISGQNGKLGQAYGKHSMPPLLECLCIILSHSANEGQLDISPMQMDIGKFYCLAPGISWYNITT